MLKNIKQVFSIESWFSINTLSILIHNGAYPAVSFDKNCNDCGASDDRRASHGNWTLI